MQTSTSNSTMLLGGYSDYSCNISPEAQEVFDTAFTGFVGVRYTPIAVATQVVNGTNYSFLCNSKTAYPLASNQAAIVNIYQPLNGYGGPHISEIRRFEPYAVQEA